MDLGDIKSGIELGFKTKRTRIWLACPSCGKERWVKQTEDWQNKKCKSCSHTIPLEKLDGNRQKTHKGYVLVRLHRSDFYYPMTWSTGLVPEHRLVMAKYLGRCLNVWEHVHHKDGNRSNNNVNNLELTTIGQHHRDHHKGYKDGYTKGLVDGRTKQIAELKLQNDDLMKQIKLLQFMVKETGGVKSI